MRLAFLLSILAVTTPVCAQSRAPRPRAAERIQTGLLLLEAGDRVSASGYFREAIQADPSHPRAYLLLGQLYLERQAFSSAQEVFEAGVERVPGDASLLRGLAQTYEAQGALDRAADALRALLAQHPDDREAMLERAELARRRAAWSEALSAYRWLIAHSELDESTPEMTEWIRYERALRLLAEPLDPVSANRACSASPVRRALAECP